MYSALRGYLVICDDIYLLAPFVTDDLNVDAELAVLDLDARMSACKGVYPRRMDLLDLRKSA